MLKISSICVLMGCVNTRDFSLSLESTHMHYSHCSLAPSPTIVLSKCHNTSHIPRNLDLFKNCCSNGVDRIKEGCQT